LIPMNIFSLILTHQVRKLKRIWNNGVLNNMTISPRYAILEPAFNAKK
jgi:hypothetical protein